MSFVLKKLDRMTGSIRSDLKENRGSDSTEFYGGRRGDRRKNRWPEIKLGI